MRRCSECGLMMPLWWPRVRCLDVEGCKTRIAEAFADRLQRAR